MKRIFVLFLSFVFWGSLVGQAGRVKQLTPSTSGDINRIIQDEGMIVPDRDTVDFTGSGVSVTINGPKQIVNIPGAIVMQGASAVVNGSAGYVPQPIIGDELKYLRGDGTWGAPPGSGSSILGSSIDKSYPYVLLYQNEFTDSIVGWENFSSGQVTLGTGVHAGRMRIIGTGVKYTASLTEGQDYTMLFKVASHQGGVRVYEEWPDQAIDSIYGVGWHRLEWLQNVDGNGDNKPVIVTTGPTDTAYIEYVYIFENNDENLVLGVDATINAIDSEVKDKLNYGAGFFWIDDFNRLDNPDTGIEGVNWITVSTLDRNMVGEDLVWYGNGGGKMELGYQKFPDIDGSYYINVFMDVKVPENDTLFIASGNSFFSGDTLTNFDGPFVFNAWHQQNVVGGGIQFITSAADTITIRSYGLQLVSYNPSAASSTYIGRAGQGTGTRYGFGTVAFGANSAFGVNASARPFGGQTDGATNAWGPYARATQWRANAFGPYTEARGVSSLALGFGAYAEAVHGVAIGRGAHTYPSSKFGFNIGYVFGADVDDFWIGNSWTHDLESETQASLGAIIPSSKEVKFHGQDAFDAKPIPDDFNVDGGDLGFYAGRATGSGESGSINFYIAEGNNGQNTKDTDIKGMELRSEEALAEGTHLYLLDISTGTLFRVRIGTTGTGPGGTGRALFID